MSGPVTRPDVGMSERESPDSTEPTPPAAPRRRSSLQARQTLFEITTISVVGMIVGLVAAFATAGFVYLVFYLNELLFISDTSRAGLGDMERTVATLLVLSLGGLAVGLIMHYGVSRRAPLGPADTIYAVQLHERLPAPASGGASTLAAALALGCGASVGQYGPLVYLGTVIGQLGNRLPLNLPHLRSTAIACGVAAAIATAFNAPLAALVFTHEVILRHYSLRMFTAVTIASACGYFVANAVFAHPPLFLIDFDGSFRAVEFLLFALEGVACGILAVVLMKALYHGARAASRVRLFAPLKPMLAGFITALVALQVPEVLGAGQDVFREAILGNSYGVQTLLLILIAKFLVTVLCLSFGFAGGVIFPSMLIGALFGALFGLVVPDSLLTSYSGISDYAICGMVAVMSPVIGAPMTALLLVFEMTRNYEVTIAAMVAVVFANLVASIWYGRSLYDLQLLQRGIDLSLGREKAYLMHRRVSEHMSDCLPVIDSDASYGQALDAMTEWQTSSAVVVGPQRSYQGILTVTDHRGIDAGTRIGALELPVSPVFDENTRIWEAMQAMRTFMGEAIAVVDSASGQYLGAVPESALIQAYLDATESLRREEHEI